jgi:hypothetical protein
VQRSRQLNAKPLGRCDKTPRKEQAIVCRLAVKCKPFLVATQNIACQERLQQPMNTIVHIGDRQIDLQGLQELHDDGQSVMLLFAAAHEPSSLTFTGADAQVLREWIDHYRTRSSQGLDFMVAKLPKQPDAALVQRLRSIAMTAEHPSHLLSYLATQVCDEETFTDYLRATFGDNSGIWLVAQRWWRGSYAGTSADTMLRFVLEETAPFWKPNEQANE